MQHQLPANLRMMGPGTARKRSGGSRRGSQESGYALLMVLFMVFLLLITSTAAVSDLRLERRRQREEEMVWRGNQYVRAIRLYYHKTGHYPQNLDDLQKGLPDLHFLRSAAYKDPLNSSDGEWRFIYVNGAGQIIGSVKYASLQQMALMDLNGGQLPGTSSGQALLGAEPILPIAPASSLTGPAAGASGTPSGQVPSTVPPATPASPDSTSAQGPSPAQPGQNGLTAPQGAPQAAHLGASTFGTPAAPQQPTGPVDGPVLGGFLTGVGSKVDQASVRIYNGGTDYNQWEFIWNPIEDQARAVQQGLGGQIPNLLGATGVTGTGGAAPAVANPSPFGAPASGGANPSPFGGPSPSATQPGSTLAPQSNPLQ
jgi:hypothetical protein